MAKAVYRRYENTTTVTYQKGENSFNNDANWRWDNKTVYAGYEWSEETGYVLTGRTHKFGLGKSDSGYDLDGYDLIYVHNVKSQNADSYHDYYTRYRASRIETHSCGDYLSDVILDYDSVPTDSRAEDGYWYEFVRMVGMSVQAEGAFRDAEGFANENGVWRPQAEIKANIEGTFK